MDDLQTVDPEDPENPGSQRGQEEQASIIEKAEVERTTAAPPEESEHLMLEQEGKVEEAPDEQGPSIQSSQVGEKGWYVCFCPADGEIVGIIVAHVWGGSHVLALS